MFIKSSFTKSGILLLSTASMLGLSACHSSEDAKKDPVVASVNGVDIHNSRVDMTIKPRLAQGQPDTPELRKEAIENLALQSVIAQEAVKKGLDKTPEVKDQIEMNKQMILTRAFVQDFVKNTPVTDDVLKAEYEKLKVQKGGNEYKARHILVATEAEAKDIIAKLKKDPSAFAALAKEKSMDPGSKVNGGDLGWFDPHGMVPEFSAAVAKLEKGKFTETPVKSQFGYHVIELDDSRALQVPPLEQVKEQLKQQVQQESLKKFIDDTKAKTKIEFVSTTATTTTTTASTVTSAATTTTLPAPAPVKK